MKRGVALLLSLSALGWLTPNLFGQYPYPYAPPVYRPAPMPYGYYPQPPYGYYPSAPMPMYPPAPVPRVYVYGPLEDSQPAPTPVQPAPKQPAKLPDAVKTTKPAATSAKPGATSAKSTVTQVQGTSSSALLDGYPPANSWSPPTPGATHTLPTFDGCGQQGCGDGCCDSGCPTCIPKASPQRGHCQFFGDIGANILVPYPSQRQAYSTTANGQTSSSDFPRIVDVSPFISLGFLSHSGWGLRADYWYLQSSEHQTIGNGDPGTTIGTPLGSNFQFTSPSQTLAAGIGADGYTFSQTLTLHVADLEIIKQCQWMDTTFLFGAGGRYAHIRQTYAATQSNPGGTNGVIIVAQDQQEASATNVFEGWGPTVSLEVIHAIPRSCFSIYGNVRGSFLWGNDTFNQSLNGQNITVAIPVVPANPITNPGEPTSSVVNHREVSIGEAEVGLQYGGRCGHVYLFVRAGASFQRWWDVGSSTSSNGNLSFIGGVARIGLAY
jgi:Legionella pneumophila major outer membrane protein precursor